MHRIFEHHDIISALVSRIAESSPHGYPVFTNNTLHVLSLTNRLIGEHALDALWAECSLWRLAMLMPAEIWLVVEEESEPPNVDDLFEISDEVYVLKLVDGNRGFTQAELGQHFISRARRVRELQLFRTIYRRYSPGGWLKERYQVHPNVLTMWHAQCSGNAQQVDLFPRLQALDISLNDLLDVEWSLAMTPFIDWKQVRSIIMRELDLPNGSPHLIDPNVSAALAQKSTSLRSLSVFAHDFTYVSSSQPVQYFGAMVSKWIQTSHLLTHLTIHAVLSPSSFDEFAQLPCLCHLVIKGWPAATGFAIGAHASAGRLSAQSVLGWQAFPSLISIDLRDMTSWNELITYFLGLFGSSFRTKPVASKLEHCNLYAENDIDIHTLLKWSSQLGVHRLLRTIHVDFRVEYLPAPTAHEGVHRANIPQLSFNAASSMFLRSLARLSNIETVDVVCGYPIIIADGLASRSSPLSSSCVKSEPQDVTLLELVHAWPQLCHFSISHVPPSCWTAEDRLGKSRNVGMVPLQLHLDIDARLELSACCPQARGLPMLVFRNSP